MDPMDRNGRGLLYSPFHAKFSLQGAAHFGPLEIVAKLLRAIAQILPPAALENRAEHTEEKLAETSLVPIFLMKARAELLAPVHEAPQLPSVSFVFCSSDGRSGW